VCGWRRHPPQCLQCASRPILLDESEQYGEQDDDGDDDRLEGMPEESRDDRGTEENEDQRVLKLLEERPPGGLAAQCLQLIRAMDAEPACRFGTLEPRQRCCELLDRLADRQRVPRDRVLRTPLETAFCDHTAPTAITHCAAQLRSGVCGEPSDSPCAEPRDDSKHLLH
jgi:hypothetical protein